MEEFSKLKRSGSRILPCPPMVELHPPCDLVTLLGECDLLPLLLVNINLALKP
jgi:hypothetical protein